MSELIKITTEKIGNEEINAVSARELWTFLESKQEFSTWIKNNISDFDFQEKKDFMIILSKSTGGRPTREYILHMDMAKELSMLARNEKGKEARKYFIEAEKKLKQIQAIVPSYQIEDPIKRAEQWIAEAKEHQQSLLVIDTQQKQLTKQKPKVEFFDDAMNSQTLIDLNHVAKTLLLKDENGKLMGRNKLYERLRSEGLLNGNNKPYQKFITQGLFKLVERSYTHPKTGESVLYFKTLLTQKGVSYMHKNFKEAK